MLLCLLLQGFSFRIVRPSVYFKTRHSKKIFMFLQSYYKKVKCGKI